MNKTATLFLMYFVIVYFQGGKVPMLQSPLGVMMGYSNDSPFTSPPPAHMGIPPVSIDPKTGMEKICRKTGPIFWYNFFCLTEYESYMLF